MASPQLQATRSVPAGGRFIRQVPPTPLVPVTLDPELGAVWCTLEFMNPSGSTKDRIELGNAMDFVREGDTLVVTRLDRLARSVADLHRIIETLNDKQVGFRCLNQSGVDTSSSTGKLMLAVLGAVAQFENDIRRERQMEGITKAKADGRYRGRPATIDPARLKELHGSGLGPAAIARELKIGRASVYRALAA
jgi:DNA invertase Pin-like site-specific DNA recombinase